MTEKISTGSFELNKFLDGGIESDIITTIYGPGGSGKSNICQIIATSQAKQQNKIVFIDTEGGFSTERFKQIHNGTQDQIEKDLQNILILKPTSFAEQEKAFEVLLSYIKKREISLIIIDSIAMLYRLELADAITSKQSNKIQKVNGQLAFQLRTLNEIARKQEIPVLITNQVYSQFLQDSDNFNAERQVSMVGGDLLKYWSKCIIQIKQNGPRRKLILKKHRSIPQKELSFEITNRGIRKRGLF